MVAESFQGPKSGALPDGWRMVTFGEMAQSINDRVDNPAEAGVDRYVGLEHLDPDTLHLHRWGLPTDVEATKLRFKPGDVIFGRRRAYQRKLAVADFEGICSAHALVLRARPETVEPRYLPVFMQSELFFKRALEISVGSLSPTINWKALAAQPFPLPPKKEQRRIADILWAADAAVERWREVARITGELTEVVLAEELRMGLKRGWKACPVRDLILAGPQNGFSPPANAQGVGYRTLSISSIRSGRVEIEGNTKYAAIDPETFDRFRLMAGDVLVVRGNGNRQLVGLCGIVTESASDIFYPDLLVRLRFDERLILQEFATAQWNSNQVHSELLRKAKSTNGIWKVNGKDLASHQMVAPPIDDQRRLLQRLHAMEQAIEASNTNVEALALTKRRTSEHLLV